MPRTRDGQVHPVSDQQVAQLRDKLDAAGVTSMDERRRLIEKLSGRPVASLRELSSAEARVLLLRIPGSDGTTSRQRGSAWDLRDEDTWIDRL